MRTQKQGGGGGGGWCGYGIQHYTWGTPSTTVLIVLGHHYISPVLRSLCCDLSSLMEKSRSYPVYSSCYYSGLEEAERSYSFNGPSGKAGDGLDPEAKRKRRVAAYNLFTMEGKVKSSVRNSFKWIKSKFTDIRYGGGA